MRIAMYIPPAYFSNFSILCLSAEKNAKEKKNYGTPEGRPVVVFHFRSQSFI